MAEDKTHLYMNDSEALDRWIEACFMDPQPSFYPKSLEPLPQEKPQKDDAVERVLKKRSSTSVIDCLQETQRFVANLLGGGVEDDKKKKRMTVKNVTAEDTKKPWICEPRLMEVSKNYSNEKTDKVAKKHKTDHHYTIVCQKKMDNRSLRQKLLAAGRVKKYKFHDFHPCTSLCV